MADIEGSSQRICRVNTLRNDLHKKLNNKTKKRNEKTNKTILKGKVKRNG